MTVLRRSTVTFMAAALAAVFGLAGVCAAAALDGNAVRQKVGPQVCLVRVDGALGLPVSYASGFLFGQGKFIVTDLASVAQPGVTQVTAIFGDGTKAQAKQFGMADPALGVVAIGVDLPKDKGAGLTLSKASVPEDGIPAAVVGWKWGENLYLTAGTLKGRMPAADLAETVALEGPAPKVEFLRFLCPKLDIATGAAVVDAQGTVVGVMVRLMGAAKPTVVPALRIRQALLSGGTQLKPLSALPNALWPVSLQVTPGRPPTPQGFSRAAGDVRRRSICAMCKGSGKVKVKYVAGYTRGLGGTRRPIIRFRIDTCKVCSGEGVVCRRGLYGYFVRMAEGATHLIASPDTTEKVSEAAFKNGMGLLAALGKVPTRYRNSLTSQIRADLGAADPKYPRGAILYAQVCESVNLRGDNFTVLVPYGLRTVLIVNSEMLTSAYGVDDSPTATAPTAGSSVVVGGVLEGMAHVQGSSLISMRLFGWAFAPAPGRGIERKPFTDEPLGGLTSAVAAATRPTPSKPAKTAGSTTSPATTTPTPTPRKRPKAPPRQRPKKKPGEPSFFGL